MSILRGKETLQLQVTLGRRPRNPRGDSQNHMGSELSSRTTGYATILQHDAVIRPKDCGGPLVDLDGKVVGMNVSMTPGDAADMNALACPDCSNAVLKVRMSRRTCVGSCNSTDPLLVGNWTDGE